MNPPPDGFSSHALLKIEKTEPCIFRAAGTFFRIQERFEYSSPTESVLGMLPAGGPVQELWGYG